MTVAETLQAARAFMAEDPDPGTIAELQDLIGRATEGDPGAIADLADRFSAPLEFGTAGLRGRVESGLARMNRLVVIKATWGLGSHLVEKDAALARSRGVVVGFDGRHSSRQFAEDAAAVLGGLRIPALVFPDPVPTPLCAFAVRQLGAAAGIMVTASHNPPADNGYKVYRGDGAQIIPPQDTEIAARIVEAPPGPQILRLQPPDAAARGLRRLIDDSLEAAYLEGVQRGSLHPADSTPLRIVYTAMHGVGHRLAIRALQRAGFEGVVSVPAQSDPDGAFRTVAFPNPEEKGAMDLALAAAADCGADLVVANDPDADRLAVAVPGPEGGFRMLSGNEIGWLLADDAIAHTDTGARPKLVVTTIVSSTLLSRMARDRGARYAEVLTGFKWLADAERKAEAEGVAFVAGYEEALGYTVGPLVRDKDGIGSAVRIAELARALKAGGESLLDRIEGLLVAHGLSHQVQWSVTLADAAGRQRIAAAMTALRTDPPQDLGGSPIVRTLDLDDGEERRSDGTRVPSTLPWSDVLAFYTQDETRLVVRPSGTEPKIKFYLEVLGRAASRADVAAERAAAEVRCQAIKAALMRRLGFA